MSPTRKKKRHKVVIVGGGIAGLTAAHELIERDFEVIVYERRRALGGKAASVRVGDDRPGEHGFRFFPGWYKHLPDTMRRIPVRGADGYCTCSTDQECATGQRCGSGVCVAM